jgi:hypothetical protein
MRVSAKEELKFAKGMMDRREHVRAGLRNVETRGQAVDNYQSLARCLGEVEKHHNNIVKSITDRTAGYAHESALLVDSARKWLAQARDVAVEHGATVRQLDDIDRAVKDTTIGVL